MPTYVFRCGRDTGGCDHLFEVKAPMSEATSLSPKCPNCKKSKHVNRDWAEENVSVCDGPKTVGSLADKNSSKMSNDHQHMITEKNTAYLKKDYTGPLPEGAKLFDKDSEGNRKATTHSPEKPSKPRPKSATKPVKLKEKRGKRNG